MMKFQGVGQKTILYFLYVLINLLFVIKYSIRLSPLIGGMASLGYLLFAGILYKVINKDIQLSGKLLITIVIAFITATSLVQYRIDPYTLNVDRWSAIHNFIHHLFQGIYPYSAQTHLGGYGSPFPIWQLFHIPFYLMGNVGASIFFVLTLFLLTARKIVDRSRHTAFVALLLTSPAFLYEIIVRSDLITNFMAVAVVINLLLWKNIRLKDHLYLLPFIIGLFLSTRLSTILPFGIVYLKEFLSLNYVDKAKCILICSATFLLTFLPFYLWNGNQLLFFEYNPFVLQTRQGSLVDMLILIPLIIYAALKWKSSAQANANCGYSLVGLVAITFFINMFRFQNFDLFSSTYDITYFNMALPYILFAINITPPSLPEREDV